MNENEKKKRLREQRRKQKAFAQRTIKLSAICALILCALIALAIPLAPKVIGKRIDASLEDRDFERAERLAAILGSEMQAQTAKRIRYTQATDLLYADEFNAAREAFLALGDYSDAETRVKECDYRKAVALLNGGEYDAALSLFLSVNGYADSLDRADLCRYQLAELACEAGEMHEAFERFEALGDYSDAKRRMIEIAVEITGIEDEQAALEAANGLSVEEMDLMNRLNEARENLKPGMIAVGNLHTVARTEDGRAFAAGDNACGQLNVGEWTDIIKIDAGAFHTVGLTRDGRVLAVGRNDEGQTNVSEWENVVDIAAGAFDTYALTADGLVLHTGFKEKNDAEGWNGVTGLCAGAYVVGGMYGNGSVLLSSEACRPQTGEAFATFDVSTAFGVGVTRMGKAVASFGDLDWDSAVTVSASGAGVLGIDAYGGVCAHFFRESEQYPFDSLSLPAVAVAAGGGHHAVLLSDGTVHVFGSNENGQADTADWKLF